MTEYDFSDIARARRRGDFWQMGYERQALELHDLKKVVKENTEETERLKEIIRDLHSSGHCECEVCCG